MLCIAGLPIVVKDSAAVKGVRWTQVSSFHNLHIISTLSSKCPYPAGYLSLYLPLQGSRIYEDRIAEEDDPHVELLERRGAIIVGKSNLPEFGAGSNTYNECVIGMPWQYYSMSAWVKSGVS